MQIKDQAAWDAYRASNGEGYGKAIIDYAERWAGLMESKMDDGRPLAEIARDTSHTADTEGITGFMYGAAVATLAKVWVHGETLRRWHNLETQIGDEGERANAEGRVLNPALLSIG